MKHGSGLIESKLPERGRGMTNGEMIQKVFNCEVCEPIIEDDIIHVIFADKKDSAIGFDWSWWIAEYKEPTTKNNLEVDCISRQEVLRLLANSIGKTNTYLQTEVLRLPSVTPQLSSGLEKNSKKLENVTTTNDLGVDCVDRGN